jgi:hypothetical protein
MKNKAYFITYFCTMMLTSSAFSAVNSFSANGISTVATALDTTASSETLNFGLLPLTLNNNQYAITMTTSQTNIKTFTITGFSSHTGSTCTGQIIVSATITSGSDITLSAGTTYTATNALSWNLVSNNGGEALWKTPACIRYQYQDNQDNTLHQKDCAVWYSGSSSNLPCTEEACGQSSVCVDSW